MKDIEIRKILGDRLAFFRKQKRFTQESLAAKINKSVDTVSNIERAKNAVSFEIVVMIVNILEISIDDLITFPNIPSKKANDYKYIKKIIKALEGRSEKIKTTAVKVLEEACNVE
ncbi:MAG: helix-turn-helix transcriptional regulator [Alphaproteobacteria bacterium]|nr:helix-turn-helix transcriptional regulator [Rickettsiales bacterium]